MAGSGVMGVVGVFQGRCGRGWKTAKKEYEDGQRWESDDEVDDELVAAADVVEGTCNTVEKYMRMDDGEECGDARSYAVD